MRSQSIAIGSYRRQQPNGRSIIHRPPVEGVEGRDGGKAKNEQAENDLEMRPVNNKRARGRNGGRRSHGGGGGANRSFESNGPDTKIRGTASQVYEKYCALARDAGSNGDYIGSENYQQHAEHYYRIMTSQAEQSAQRQQPRHNGHQSAAEQGGGQRREETPTAAAPEPPLAVDPAEAEQPVIDIEPASGD